MQPFKTFTGIVASLDRPNVDTDSIIPKQYLKSIKRTGFGPNLFDDWRYLEPGNPGDDHTKRKINSEFFLNQPRYKNAEILLTRENFGCGSSREHAIWSLMDFGFRAVIAPSFAEIFYSNAFKNGLLLIILDGEIIDQLVTDALFIEGYSMTIDVEQLKITTSEDQVILFSMDKNSQDRLLNGLDEIAVTLGHADKIKGYEEKRRQEAPWLFQSEIKEV